MILQRPSGYYVVLLAPGKAPVTLGGPYSKEAALRKEDRLIKAYQAKEAERQAAWDTPGPTVKGDIETAKRALRKVKKEPDW